MKKQMKMTKLKTLLLSSLSAFFLAEISHAQTLQINSPLPFQRMGLLQVQRSPILIFPYLPRNSKPIRSLLIILFWMQSYLMLSSTQARRHEFFKGALIRNLGHELSMGIPRLIGSKENELCFHSQIMILNPAFQIIAKICKRLGRKLI